MSNTYQVLQDMAKLTVMTNKMTDLQLHNLKMYPFVFFDNVQSVNISYDLESKKTMDDEPAINSSSVSYYLVLNTNEIDNLDKRAKALETAVRQLLWNDISIEVYLNKKIIWKSDSHE